MMPKKKLLRLAADDLYRQAFPPELRAELERRVETDVVGEQTDMSAPEWIKKLEQADVILGGWNWRHCLPETYEAPKPQLWCHLTGTVARVVHPHNLRHGVRLTNWGDAISHTIAECSHMLILACLRRLGYEFRSIVNARQWAAPDMPAPMSLFEKRVGIVGFGRVAQKLAPLLRPYRVKIAALDPYVPDAVFEQFGVRRVTTREALFQESDIVSLNSAKSSETNNLVDAGAMNLLPAWGVIVNTGRGNILNENDLAAQHAAGRLFSGLDVFAVEPIPPDHPLRDTPRCVISTHQAGPTTDMYPEMGKRAMTNILNFLDGKPLIDEITADMLPRMT
ncbi:MAG: hypothetical protein HY343_06820 [Lentisphaerae bacterium]|nr:hypothetical protein [Lentisphaerota bacterium]